MGVITGMDPHKRSATIEVIDERARVLAAGRYDTDNVCRWSVMPRGGHFAPAQEPHLVAGDIAAFFAALGR